MYFSVKSDMIPGTVIKKSDMDGATGLEFLNKVYFLRQGIPLSQIRTICGLDGSTLQNWVKRGWIMNTTHKQYSIDTFARILIINMLRDSLQLSKISFLLSYINGDLTDTEDDIISESKLYDYICRITESIERDEGIALSELGGRIKSIVNKGDINKSVPNADERLYAALEVIITSYYASMIISRANELYDGLPR
ncbi:MAG: DUF1836 domain-containing protein [Firmicutes bacterium]|nr:DUF1836 domain-containing protein [Bacillota bacterium]